MKLNIFYLTIGFLLLGCQPQKKPLNIIFLIGDGMGLSQISAGILANNNASALEEFTSIGLVKTHANDNLVTDSAASGTAMACGVKTNNGTIGIDANGKKHTSIVEICDSLGYKTALLATSTIVHATPASFYAKVSNRREYERIAEQLSEHNISIFSGGGKVFFEKRSDSINLIKKMKNKYDIVSSFSDFKSSNATHIGFFTADNDPQTIVEGRSPNLGALTRTTLKKLQNYKQPFFAMIEGSQIDWGGHANNTDYIITEFIDFNLAIKEALKFAKNDGNTLIIVTADHETGGFAITGENFKKLSGNFTTTHHTATMVPIFSYGPSSEKFSTIMDNTQIFYKLREIVLEK